MWQVASLGILVLLYFGFVPSYLVFSYYSGQVHHAPMLMVDELYSTCFYLTFAIFVVKVVSKKTVSDPCHEHSWILHCMCAT